MDDLQKQIKALRKKIKARDLSIDGWRTTVMEYLKQYQIKCAEILQLKARITELQGEQSNLEIPYFLRQPGAVEEDVRKHIDELKQKLSEYDNAFQDMRDIYCESTISNDGSASLMYQVIRRLNKPLRRSIEGDSAEMSHKCHAIGCDELCDPEKLMCLKHWKMLPKLRRASVLREYRTGQCLNDPTPSPQWHDAADAAIYWVHIAELRARLARPQKFPGLARSRFLKGRQIAIEEDGDEIIHLPEKCVLWACEFSGKNIKLIKGKDGDWVCPNCGYSYGEPQE